MLSVKGVKTCREIAWEHALTSEMNVGYYRHKVAAARRLDSLIKILAILTALSGFGTFVAQIKPWGIDLSPWLSLIAAIAMSFDLVMQFPEKVRELGVLLSEYTGHHARFEALYQFGCTEDDVKAAIAIFQDTVQKEAKVDPNADAKLLEREQAKIMRRIHAA